MTEWKKRKKTRLENYDYNSCGAYFVTVCTEQSRKILSQIVGGDVLDAPLAPAPAKFVKINKKFTIFFPFSSLCQN